MEKLYRRHCGGLKESLATTIKVTCLNDILDIENKNMKDDVNQPDYFDSIKTEYYSDDSVRIGKKWKKEYVVLLHSNFVKEPCKWVGVGFCNFKDDSSFSDSVISVLDRAVKLNIWLIDKQVKDKIIDNIFFKAVDISIIDNVLKVGIHYSLSNKFTRFYWKVKLYKKLLIMKCFVESIIDTDKQNKKQKEFNMMTEEQAQELSGLLNGIQDTLKI